MKYYLKVLKEQKKDIKMNNQTDRSFDLIFLSDKSYNQAMNKLNYSFKRDIQVNLAWELKMKRNNFKVYKNIKIIDIKENFNPFKKRNEGVVISFSCDSVDYYTTNKNIGKIVPKSSQKYKDTKILLRTLKLSNINFK